jgi:hypothetical protein
METTLGKEKSVSPFTGLYAKYTVTAEAKKPEAKPKEEKKQEGGQGKK